MANPFFERQEARAAEQKETEDLFNEPETNQADRPVPTEPLAVPEADPLEDRPPPPDIGGQPTLGRTARQLLEGLSVPGEVIAGLGTGFATFLTRVPFAIPRGLARLSGRQPTPEESAPVEFFDEKIAPFLQYQPQGKFASDIVRTIAAPFEIAKRELEDAGVHPETADAVVDIVALFGPKFATKSFRFARDLGQRGSISIKNAAVDAARQAEGLAPATRGERLSQDQANIKAEAVLKKDPFAGKKLAEELNASPRPPTGVEDLILIRDRVRIAGERKAAELALVEAGKTGDAAAIETALARIDQARQDFQVSTNASTLAGTESALSLVHRRAMLNEDLSLTSMEMSRMIENDGKLNVEQAAEVKVVFERYDKAREGLEKKTIAHQKRREVREAPEREAKESVAEELRQAEQDFAEPITTKPGQKGVSPEQGERLKQNRVLIEEGEQPRVITEGSVDVQFKKGRKGILVEFAEGKEPKVLSSEGITFEAGKTKYAKEIKAQRAKQPKAAPRAPKEPKVLTDAQRARRVEAALERSIKQVELELSGKKAGKGTTGEPISTPKIEELREVLKEKRADLKEIKEVFDPKKTPEEKRVAALKSRLRNRIAKIKERTAKGEFETPAKPDIPLDPESQALRVEMEAALDSFNELKLKDRLAKRGTAKRILDAGVEIVNLSRAVITSLDLSAVLRQGGFISLANPVRAAKIFPDMIRSLGSVEAQRLVDLQIKQRPNARLYKEYGLFLSERSKGLVQMEEVYMARHVDKIPLVAGSQRAFVTFLNRLRADSFDAIVKSLGKEGRVTPVEGKAIANFVNVATGRGSASAKAGALVGMSTVFFAPRLVLSRFQLAVGQPFVRGSFRTRKLIAQEYGRFLAGLAVVYSLGELAGADIEKDPRSSDFGKMKFGNARVDPLTGLSQITVLTSRLATGETKGLRTGRVKELGEGFGQADEAAVLGKFLRTKLSPVIGAGVNILAGENVIGEQVTPESTVTDLIAPLAMRDIYETMLDQGVPKGTALGMLSLLGMSLQTFDVTKRTPVDRRSFSERMRDRLGLEGEKAPVATRNPFKVRAEERAGASP